MSTLACSLYGHISRNGLQHGDTSSVLRKWCACGLIAVSLLASGCENDAESFLASVEALESKQEYATAISKVKGGLRDDPSNGGLRYRLARLYMSTFDYQAAEFEFRQIGRQGIVEGGRVSLGLARALYQQRKYAEVIDVAAASLAFEPGILASLYAVRANAFLNMDQVGEARRELASAMKLDATSADVALMQARIAATARNLTQSVRSVEQLIEQDPENVEAWLHKADLMTILERPHDALKCLDRVISVRPHHRDALVSRAIMQVRIGRLEAAQKDVETLAVAYPKADVVGYLRGQIHYWKREYREALDRALAVMRVNNDDAPARLLSAMGSMMLDAATQAEHDLTRYTALHPRNTYARRVLVDLRKRSHRKGSDSKVIASVHSEELRQASVQAVFGDAYIRAWQYSSVAGWFERVAELAPLDPMSAVRHAQKRFSTEQLAEAASDLERVVSANDEGGPADTALVLLHLARRDIEKAMQAVDAADRKSPASAQPAAIAGLLSLERRDFAGAERHLSHALQRDRLLLSAVVARARLDIARNNIDSARGRFKEALKALPNDPQALVVYAQFEEAFGERGEAMTLLNRAVRADPKALEPKLALVHLFKKNDDKVRALAVAEEALAEHPEDPVAIEQAGEMRLWNGDAERALKAFQDLVRVAPKSPESYYKLARAQFKAGRAAESEANLQMALALPADDPATNRLHLAGLDNDTKTLEAIEVARRSFNAQRSAASTMQMDRELRGSMAGGKSLYEALSAGKAK